MAQPGLAHFHDVQLDDVKREVLTQIGSGLNRDGSAFTLPVEITDPVEITGPVEITNDAGNPIPVRQFASTSATTARIPSSATAVTLLAMNPVRNQAIIYNESTQTLKIKLGSGASATDYTLPIAGGTPTGGYYELPVRYTGIITGIWDSADGFAQVTEF